MFTDSHPMKAACVALAMVFGAARSAAAVLYPDIPAPSFPADDPALPAEMDVYTPPVADQALAASAPALAEWTRTAGPGDVLAITGDKFSLHAGSDLGKDTAFLVYGQTTAGDGVLAEAAILRLADASKGAVALPASLPSDSLYLLWPRNDAGCGAPVAVNQAETWWLGPDTAWTGGTVSVYGRNLSHDNSTNTSWVYLQPAGSAGQWCEVTAANPYKVDVAVPAGLTNGVYEVWLHNGHGGRYGWGGPLTLQMQNPKFQWTGPVFDVTSYGAVADDGLDDGAALRTALAAAAASPGATVALPAGTFHSSLQLNIPDHVRLQGAGKDVTFIKMHGTFNTSGSGTAETCLIGSANGAGDNSEIADLTLDTDGHLTLASGDKIFNRSGISWVRYTRVKIVARDGLGAYSGITPVSATGDYQFWTDCDEIVSKHWHLGRQAFFTGCNWYGVHDANVLLESWGQDEISVSHCTAQDYDNSDPDDPAGWAQGRFFSGNLVWGSTCNQYFGDNRTVDMAPRPGFFNQNTGEQFMWEGGGTSFAYGAPTAATAWTLTMPTLRALGGQPYLTVTRGKGVGQSRQMIACDLDTRTATLDRPWNVIPDATSIVHLHWAAANVAIYNNILDGKAEAVIRGGTASAGIQPFCAAVNFVGVGNVMTDVGTGISNWGMAQDGTSQLQPNLFSFYADNRISDSRMGIFQIEAYASSTEDSGVSVLGTMFRNNVIDTTVSQAVQMYKNGTWAPDTLSLTVFDGNVISNVAQGIMMNAENSHEHIQHTVLHRNVLARGDKPLAGSVALKFGNSQNPVLRGNSYADFETTYGTSGTLPGAILELPARVIAVTAAAGGSAQAVLPVWNAGTASLNWSADDDAAWLTLSPLSETVPDERSADDLTLTCNAAGLSCGTYTGTVTLTAGSLAKKAVVLFKVTDAGKPTVAITATDADAAEAGSEAATFTVTRSDTDGDLTVRYSVSGTADADDYVETLGGSVMIPDGSLSALIVITPVDDAVAESSETVVLALRDDPAYNVGWPDWAQAMIADNNLPAVSIVATVSSATEGVSRAEFTLTRSGGSGDLAIHYTKSGTATAADYSQPLAGTAVIPDGYASVVVYVSPVADNVSEGDETVTLTLAPGAGYTVGAPSDATVTLIDATPVTITVKTLDAASENAGETGSFAVMRNGIYGATTVFYTLGGTAGSGDYQETLSGSVVIPEGACYTDITVTPVDDGEVEGNETLILTLSAHDAYTVGTPGAATLTLADNDGLPANYVGVFSQALSNSGFETAGSGGEADAADWDETNGSERRLTYPRTGLASGYMPSATTGNLNRNLDTWQMGWNADTRNGAVNAPPGTLWGVNVHVAQAATGTSSMAFMLHSTYLGYCQQAVAGTSYGRYLYAGLRNTAMVASARPWLRMYPAGSTVPLLADDLSSIQWVRPELGVSDTSPITFGTVNTNVQAASAVRILRNSQTATQWYNATETATILYGAANVASATAATDHVGARIIGVDAALFEFVTAHPGADGRELRFVGADGAGGLKGGPAPEAEVLQVRFLGAAVAGGYAATIRIVTPAGNVGVVSAGAADEPLAGLCYVDIPVTATVEAMAPPEEMIAPMVENRPVEGVTTNGAVFNGWLVSNGTAAAAARVFWGESDGTPAGVWARTNTWASGAFADNTPVSTNISGLAPDSTYYYTFAATNALGSAVAEPAVSFITGEVTVEVTDGTAQFPANLGRFTLRRPESATHEALVVAYTMGGSAEGGTDYEALCGSVMLEAGAASAEIIVIPRDAARESDVEAVLTLVPGPYALASPPGAATVTILALPPPGRLYVATSGDNSDGSTWAAAYTNLQTAIDAAVDGDTIYLKGETFAAYNTASTLESQWVWISKGLTILGGYAADGGTPGALTNTATVLTQPAPNGSTYTNRILYVENVTNGTLARVTISGGRLRSGEQNAWRRDVYGSGMYIRNSSNLTFSTVIIDGNYISFGQQVKQWGAGVYALNSWGTFTNCVFRNNRLPRHYGNTSYGGGAHLQGGGWTLRDCLVRDNMTDYQGTYGDSAYGIGLYLNGGTHLVKNCLFSRNYGASVAAPQGEAVYVASGTVNIENSTLYWHRYEGLRRAGTATVTLRDSIVWDCGDDIVGTVTLQNNCIQDGDSNGSNGNIADAPLFERGLYLSASSPCISTGSVTAAEAGLSGYTTRADGTADTGVVDIGYHYPPGTAAVDFYVDAANGSDANNGLSAGSAFKTITKALSLVADGGQVNVNTGTYNTANGEVFPLKVANKCGVQILGTDGDLTILDANGANQRCMSMMYNYPFAKVSGITLKRGRDAGASAKGAGLYLAHVQGLVVDCAITDNELPNPKTWTSSGGGGLGAVDCGMVVSNCIVRNNSVICWFAGYSVAGGGIYADNLGTIVNCIIVSNKLVVSGNASYHPPAYGGGLYINGNTTVRNCLIAANDAQSSQYSSPRGDAAYVAGGTVLFENCTIVTNHPSPHARWGDTYTGGLGIERAGSSTVTLRNSILWGNGTNVLGTATLNFCNVGVVQSSVTTNNCISEDPLFVDPAGGNYRLRLRPVRSPSLNAGQYQAWMDGAADLDGNPRVQNKVVDMGAYETLIPAGGTVMLLR